MGRGEQREQEVQQRLLFHDVEVAPTEVRRLLQGPILIALIASLVILLVGFLGNNSRDVLLAGIGAIGSAFALFLLSRRRKRAAAYTFTTVSLALTIGILTTGKGVHDVGIVLLPLVIVTANLFYNRRAALIVGWGTALAGGCIAAAEAFGILHTEFAHQTEPEDALELFIVLGATVLILQQLLQVMDRAMHKAASEERGYREIFNATSEAIFVHDAKTGEYLDANQAALRLGPYEREELIGGQLSQVLSNEKEARSALELIQNCRERGPQMFNWTIRSKDGTERFFEAALQPAYLRNQDVVLAVLRDNSELLEMRQRAVQGEKLQVVGQLAGGVAHDFNNQLTGIVANAELLSVLVAENTQATQAVDAIIRCSNRSADLTAQLLAFARRGKHQNVNVDIHALIAEVVSLLDRSIDKRIQIKLELYRRTLFVRGDPTLLQNALLNLGLNARDAMPNGGTLTFRTTSGSDRPPSLSSMYEAARRSTAEPPVTIIEVEDTGIGMDEATRQRVFEPFFSTKRTGNGMGLAAVYGAVESHGGQVSVRSRPMQGTTFHIELPSAEHQAKGSEGSLPRLATGKTQLEGLRVLFAEDEKPVARIATLLLDELGCKVTHLENGQAALDAFRKNRSAFDLALLDHMMPKLSGREVLAEIRKHDPDFPCVITSGYANDAVIEGDANDAVFLPKPFKKSDLALALANAMSNQFDEETAE